MGFEPTALLNPYFTAMVGGLFLGLYFALMPRFPQKTERKEQLKKVQSRWGGFLLFMGPLVILSGALFFPTPDYLSVQWLLFLGVSLLLFFAVFRFPRAMGIPIFLITGVLVYTGWEEMRRWVRVEPSVALVTYVWMPTDGGGNVSLTLGSSQGKAFAGQIQEEPFPLTEMNLPIWGELIGGRRWITVDFDRRFQNGGDTALSDLQDWFLLSTYFRLFDWVEVRDFTWPARVPWKDQFLWFRAGSYSWSDEDR
jgi:hypothetical protein